MVRITLSPLFIGFTLLMPYPQVSAETGLMLRLQQDVTEARKTSIVLPVFEGGSEKPKPEMKLRTMQSGGDGWQSFRLGNPSATTEIQLFTDFECPYCRQYWPRIRDFVIQNESSLSLVIRHVPVSKSSQDSIGKAALTECVGQVAGHEAYWMLVDQFFKQPLSLKEASQVAQQIAINNGADNLAPCESIAQQLHSQIMEDLTIAKGIGVSVTPTTVIFDSVLDKGVSLAGNVTPVQLTKGLGVLHAKQ